MPPGVNQAALASAGAIAVSVALAAAIAIYESPELRRYTDDIRRRIAIALTSLGEGIQPPERPPVFNRPEDAQGFLESRRGVGAEPGVDADEASRRRQREELMYWNALHMEKKAREQQEQEQQQQQQEVDKSLPPGALSAPKRSLTFDDFLRQDENAERGTLVFNTGTNVRSADENLVRRRHEGVRGLNSALYANPFTDEHQIDRSELPGQDGPSIAPVQDEIMSDIYSATTRDAEEAARDMSATISPPALIDISEDETRSERSQTLDHELGQDEYMTAGQDDRVSDEAYASIQAWAQRSTSDFYSPLPMSPPAPVSEPELVSDGVLTPTDSVSLIGSGDDIANDAASSRADENGRHYDVMSESDGMMTPASWSEVGSVVSENDGPVPVRAV